MLVEHYNHNCCCLRGRGKISGAGGEKHHGPQHRHYARTARWRPVCQRRQGLFAQPSSHLRPIRICVDSVKYFANYYQPSCTLISKKTPNLHGIHIHLHVHLGLSISIFQCLRSVCGCVLKKKEIRSVPPLLTTATHKYGAGLNRACMHGRYTYTYTHDTLPMRTFSMLLAST